MFEKLFLRKVAQQWGQHERVNSDSVRGLTRRNMTVCDDGEFVLDRMPAATQDAQSLVGNEMKRLLVQNLSAQEEVHRDRVEEF